MRVYHLLALVLSCVACASANPARLAPPPSPPRSIVQPAPALRGFEGRVPLVSLAQRPAPGSAFVPTYRLAIFDDGTVIYEGARCVKVGGIVITRLPADELQDLRAFLAPACGQLQHPPSDELCQERERILDITCSDGERIHTQSNRCHEPVEAEALQGFADHILQRAAGPDWLGQPTQRQACDPGAAPLSAPDWFPLRNNGRWPAFAVE